MESSIFVAIITILGATLTFYMTKRHEINTKWQQEKFNHYKVLLSSLSQATGNYSGKEESLERFALSCNTIALVAPQSVILLLMELQDSLKMPVDCIKNQKRFQVKFTTILNKLLLEIRKDIGLSQIMLIP